MIEFGEFLRDVMKEHEWLCFCCRIACISCPTLYARLHSMNPADCTIVCLEFDQRFLHFGDGFVFYDYNEPVALPAQLKASFDLVVVDPPFLSEECLQKIAQTVHYLTTKKILLCTGMSHIELVNTKSS